MNIPKSNKISKALQRLYRQVLIKLRFQLAPRMAKAVKKSPRTDQGKSGVVHIATRWIIERSDGIMQEFSQGF